MNTNGLTRQYDKLTPQERFCLIFAAGIRDDDAERERLINSGGRITLSIGDHYPWGQAFQEVEWWTYTELCDEAAKYNEAYQRWAEIEFDCAESLNSDFEPDPN